MKTCLKLSYFELGMPTWYKREMYTPHEILTFTYGMELKLELLLGDYIWHQHFITCLIFIVRTRNRVEVKPLEVNLKKSPINFIGYESFQVQVLTLYHIRRLNKRKGPIVSMWNLVSKLWVILRNCNLIMRRNFLFKS